MRFAVMLLVVAAGCGTGEPDAVELSACVEGVWLGVIGSCSASCEIDGWYTPECELPDCEQRAALVMRGNGDEFAFDVRRSPQAQTVSAIFGCALFESFDPFRWRVNEKGELVEGESEGTSELSCDSERLKIAYNGYVRVGGAEAAAIGALPEADDCTGVSFAE